MSPRRATGPGTRADHRAPGLLITTVTGNRITVTGGPATSPCLATGSTRSTVTPTPTGRRSPCPGVCGR
ncbi:hypothetical protein AQ490_07145 [Wenjunlia vitaminophila]|uniref:Uncharacterized protein n=1 Tax=Wenjunlia vitaminophila TaxID=76728 RepID=A0A0T6LME0_WENVI|nr:hypothetical protein AQ490_07145 [Wenjunlia vitaminophila]